MSVETNLLVAVDDDRQLAVAALQARGPDGASFNAVLLRANALPLVLSATGLPITNDRWELRASGLWVEAVCEQPGVHWSYGLEAFALAVERPDELLGRGYGHRTPLGWEIDFETDPVIDSGAVDAGQVEIGRVEGLVLTGPGEAGELAFSGPGWRSSTVGLAPSPPSPVPVLAAVAGAAIEVALPLTEAGPGGPVWWVGHDGQALTMRWTMRGAGTPDGPDLSAGSPGSRSRSGPGRR